jgi:hypothetical protein
MSVSRVRAGGLACMTVIDRRAEVPVRGRWPAAHPRTGRGPCGPVVSLTYARGNTNADMGDWL